MEQGLVMVVMHNVDSAGNAYVSGETSSSDFPTANAIDESSKGGEDAFVTKIPPIWEYQRRSLTISLSPPSHLPRPLAYPLK